MTTSTKYQQPIHYIEEVPNDHLVSLYVEATASLFLELFSGGKQFLLGDLNFGHTGLVGAVVSAPVSAWAALCRKYPNDEFVKTVEHHFYTKHFTAWVTEGMV